MSGKWTSTDPNPNDEYALSVSLYGNRQHTHVKIDGWTHHFPTEFPTVRVFQSHLRSIDLADLTGTNLQSPKNDPNRFARREYQTNRCLLRDLCNIPGAYGSKTRKLMASVDVIVVGKKQLETTVSKENGTILVFGHLIVADDSGMSCLKMVNEGIPTIYDRVTVGNRLFITSGSIQLGHTADLQSTFGKHESFLPYLIKLNEVDAFNSFKLSTPLTQHGVHPAPASFMPEKLLWSPTTFEKSDVGLKILKTLPFADVIGVISHVSRLERCRRITNNVIMHETKTTELFVQFDAVGWIEIVDSTCKTPVPIQIYFGSTTWQKYRDLIPGSLVLVTNVQYGSYEINYQHDHLRASRFSELMINSKIPDYLYHLSQRPSIQSQASEFFGTNASLRILKRPDIIWSVGGHYSRTVKNDASFIKLYYKKLEKDNIWKNKPNIPLLRRESQVLVFPGMILRYKLVEKDWDEVKDSWDWFNAPAWEKLKPKNRDTCQIYDPIAIHTKVTSQWFMFTRELPPVDYSQNTIENRIRNNPTSTDLYEFTAQKNLTYTKPLCMPSDICKELKKLDVLDGTPHLLVDIYNLRVEERGFQRFITTWRPCRYLSIEQMKHKIEDNGFNAVLPVIILHRTESQGLDEKFGYEFVLQDIVPYIDDPKFCFTQD